MSISNTPPPGTRACLARNRAASKSFATGSPKVTIRPGTGSVEGGVRVATPTGAAKSVSPGCRVSLLEDLVGVLLTIALGRLRHVIEAHGRREGPRAPTHVSV